MAALPAACPDDPLGPGRWPDPPGPDRWRGLLDESIISFSGWRRVFASSGDPESLRPEGNPYAALFAAAAGYVFGQHLAQTRPGAPVAAVALDTRPTSAAAGCAVIRGLLAAGARVRFPGVAPTPEAMAFIALEPGLDGLVIVTASHNPPGWNGVKFSAGDGRVLPRDRAQALEDSLRTLLGSESGLKAFYTGLRGVDPIALDEVYAHSAAEKRHSLAAYRRHATRELTAEASASGRAGVLEQLGCSLKRRPLGIVAELNGSARTASIDREFLAGLGLKVRAVNHVPGRIAHAILPEGEALHPACRVLELAALEDHAFELGYVPDCDGDRGNVVILNPEGAARPLEAQEVFALAVTAELSFLAASDVVSYDSSGVPSRRLAVVVNCCTSSRIEQIAGRFGAQVFRSEVGEANVVGLAEHLRHAGWLVRILGEGSNGGNITHPSRVRDPLSTVLALVKLLRLEGVLEQWAKRSEGTLAKGCRSLGCILESLPWRFTTGQYEPRSLLPIASQDHDCLKTVYERLFNERWDSFRQGLGRRLGVVSYGFMNYEGQRAFAGPGRRSAGGRGGFKVLLTDRRGHDTAWVWMRGSRTEPVFRVMADVASSRELENELLDYHRALLVEADSLAAGRSG